MLFSLKNESNLFLSYLLFNTILHEKRKFLQIKKANLNKNLCIEIGLNKNRLILFNQLRCRLVHSVAG
jgi:hypothetical protein